MNPQQAITKADVLAGRTFYVKYTDCDANMVRYHGPFSQADACYIASKFERIGHRGEVVDTPGHVQAHVAA